MAQFTPPEGVFQPSEISVLQEAFEAVWQTIVAHRPTQAANSEFRTAVSEKICQIAAAEGATDAAKLRSATLASFTF